MVQWGQRALTLARAVMSAQEEVFRMARFYDTANESDLARVEGVLTRGGIEYSCQESRGEPTLKEIRVAEEDMARAQELLERLCARC